MSRVESDFGPSTGPGVNIPINTDIIHMGTLIFPFSCLVPLDTAAC